MLPEAIPEITTEEIQSLEKIGIEDIVNRLTEDELKKINRVQHYRRQADELTRALSRALLPEVKRARNGENVRIIFDTDTSRYMHEALSNAIRSRTGHLLDLAVTSAALLCMQLNYSDVFKIGMGLGTVLSKSKILAVEQTWHQAWIILNLRIAGRQTGDVFPSVDEFIEDIQWPKNHRSRVVIDQFYRRLIDCGNIQPKNAEAWEDDNRNYRNPPTWQNVPFIVVSKPKLGKMDGIVYRASASKADVDPLKNITLADHILGQVVLLASRLQEQDGIPIVFSAQALARHLKIDRMSLMPLLKDKRLSSKEGIPLFTVKNGIGTFVNPAYPRLDDERIMRLLGPDWRERHDPKTDQVAVVRYYYDPVLAAKEVAE